MHIFIAPAFKIRHRHIWHHRCVRNAPPPIQRKQKTLKKGLCIKWAIPIEVFDNLNSSLPHQLCCSCFSLISQSQDCLELEVGYSFLINNEGIVGFEGPCSNLERCQNEIWMLVPCSPRSLVGFDVREEGKLWTDQCLLWILNGEQDNALCMISWILWSLSRATQHNIRTFDVK